MSVTGEAKGGWEGMTRQVKARKRQVKITMGMERKGRQDMERIRRRSENREGEEGKMQ